MWTSTSGSSSWRHAWSWRWPTRATIRGANRSYYLFDGLGSVVAVTNSSGSVTNSYTYDPYGVTTETKAALTDVFNPWRYAGQYQDVSTGLYKMGARYYQPELGRWTQRDPSGQDANAYAYVGGNPVNLVDPTGLFSVDCGYISCTLYLDYEKSQAYAVGVATLSSLVALAPEPVVSKILAGAGYLSAGFAGVALSFGNCTSFRVSLTAFFGGAPVSQGFYDCG